MKTFQIEDAKTRFFKSKEDYLSFKQAWKDFHNTQPLVEWKDKDITPYYSDKEPVYARTKYPVLGSEHYMLYNLLRGYEITRGYSPLTNEGRLNANLYPKLNPWRNCEGAVEQIIRLSRKLENVNHTSKITRKLAREQVEYIMQPFGDTLSYEALLEVAGLLYEYMGEESFPTIEIQEWKVIEDPKPMSIADRVKSWRTA